MTLATNAFTTFDAAGEREDLSDVIYMVSPTDTPLLTGIPRTTATNTLHQWQSDALATAATNAVLEGDESTTDAATATTLLSNTCQISDKVPRVTGTMQAVTKAGRQDELAYQVYKRTLELRRDMETDLCGTNNAEVTGGNTTAREYGNIAAWVTTNTSNGTSGSDGSGGNTARTDGTQRALTETLLKDVIKQCFDSGGDPECIMVGSFNKQKISSFTGNATRVKTAEDRALVATVDVYASDFGDLEIIPNRFQRARDCLIIEKRMMATAYLRPVTVSELSKTGDSERRLIVVEYTLEMRNEAAHGAVWDLTTS